MQTSNSYAYIPYIALNNISNPENKASGSSTEPAEGNFSGHRVDKFEPASDSQSCLLDTTNTRQLKNYNSLYDRTSKALEHKFDGSEQTFKRKLAIKGALPNTGTYLLGCTAMLSGVLATVGTGGIAAPAVVATEMAVCSALLGYAPAVNAKHKYFIHEKKWFQQLVDKEHMELFLKEVPEEDDIKALEAFVVKINKQLSKEQFDNTYKSLKKALRNCPEIISTFRL